MRKLTFIVKQQLETIISYSLLTVSILLVAVDYLGCVKKAVSGQTLASAHPETLTH
jgi:hypothetical protein